MKKTLRVLAALLLCLCLALPAQESAPEKKNWMRESFGNILVNAEGKEIPRKKVQAQIIGVYFSAHWCPPCRAFTPKLVQTYNKIRKKNKESFQIIFISYDRTEKDMRGYMNETAMPWLALPFASPHQKILGNAYNVRGIPTLLIFDSNGNLLSANGRGDVQRLGEQAYQEWRNAAKRLSSGTSEKLSSESGDGKKSSGVEAMGKAKKRDTR